MFRHELWSTGRTPPSHLAAANQPRNHWALWTFVVAGDLDSTYWLNAPRRATPRRRRRRRRRWRFDAMVPSFFCPPPLFSYSFLSFSSFILHDFTPISTGVTLRIHLVPDSTSYVLTCPPSLHAATTHNRAPPSSPVQQTANEKNTLYFAAVACAASNRCELTKIASCFLESLWFKFQYIILYNASERNLICIVCARSVRGREDKNMHIFDIKYAVK